MKFQKITYSCEETCGQVKPCGNKYCSAHPNYKPPTPKKKRHRLRKSINPYFRVVHFRKDED